MDNLDRMYRHLVRTIRSRFPQYLTQPFDVGELHQTILPYRHHRRELGLETNEDYEITLTELLSGARDYLIVDDRMRDVLKAELASTNPDPSKFKQFARRAWRSRRPRSAASASGRRRTPRRRLDADDRDPVDRCARRQRRPNRLRLAPPPRLTLARRRRRFRRQLRRHSR